MVLSEKIYEPSEFVEILTGRYYYFDKENTVEEIEVLLDLTYDEGALWSYPLSEIDHISDNDLNVVLVDVSGFYGGKTIQPLFRWFEVPSDFIELEKANG